MQLQKIISLLLFTVRYKAIPYWKGQKLKFYKKKLFRSRPISHRNQPENFPGITPPQGQVPVQL